MVAESKFKMDKTEVAELINFAVSSALDKQSEVQAKQMTDFQLSIEEKINALSTGDVKPDIEVASQASSSSDTSQIEFIKTLIKPNFSSNDANAKYAQDRLYKIQTKLESQIVKLAYSKPTDGTPPKHNYPKWRKGLIKFFKSLSPVLAEETEAFLDHINIDDFIQGKMSSTAYPTLSDDDYPDMAKLAAMSALANSVSEDFEHLIDGDSMTDIFPSLVNIHCTCRPNTDDDRAEELISFWDQRMNSLQTVSQFGFQLKAARNAYNAASTTDQISESQLIAALKNGIKKGAQSARYAEALMVMRFKVSNPNFNSMLLWLDQNCDKTKPIDSGQPSAIEQQSSMARTRGGHGGGKGSRGRGGKGRRGRGGRGGKGNQNLSIADDNNTGNNQNYYKVDGANGNQAITKEISDYRPKRPCFTKFEEGKCDIPDCPYNHDFNLTDCTRMRSESKQHPSDDSSSSSAAISQTQTTSQPSAPTAASTTVTEGMHSYPDEQDNSDFDFAYDLGFRSSSATSGFSHSASATSGQQNLPMFGTKAYSTSTNQNLLQAFLLTTIAVLFALSDFPARFCDLSTRIFDNSTKISTLVACCLLFLYKSVTKKFHHSVSHVSLRSAPCHRVKPQYQIILDGGCTFTMSGDKGLFVPSSLSPIDESVGLAESGHAVKATHYGKIVVDGELVDSLYVPDFRQTMISMGQLEKMGLTYKVAGNLRHFYTPNDSIYLSFNLSPNNLYILSPRQNSNSASAAN